MTPVIGIIQVGGQASADRYMYIPLVGLTAIAVFGGFDFTGIKSPVRIKTIYVFFSIIFILFSVKSHFQSKVWMDSDALFANMVNSSPNPAQGLVNIGLEYKNKGDYDKAIEYYKMAIEADPFKADAYNNLGNALFELKDTEEARHAYKKACELNPKHPVMVYNYGLLEEMSGDFEKAKKMYLRALSINPNAPSPRLRLIYLLRKENKLEEALIHSREGWSLVEYETEFPRQALSILINLSRYSEAKGEARRALKNFPRDPIIVKLYGKASLLSGDLTDAEKAFEELALLNPADAENLYNLAEIKLQLNKPERAINYLLKAVESDPDNYLYKKRLDEIMKNRESPK